MKLLQIENCCGQVDISLIDDLVYLDLKVYKVFLLEVYKKVDTCDYHKREKDAEHYS
jgi:hypothetical protein